MLFSSDIYQKIHKLLKLDKPLIIFDIETTGTNISADKIISLAFVKIRIDGRGIRKEEYLFDPETKIDPEATAIHGIRLEDVAGRPKFREKASELFERFKDCYYGGYNVMNFDLPVLRREFIRSGMDFEYRVEDVIDSREIYRYMSPRSLEAAYRHYCKKELKNRHSAMADTEATAEVLLKQLERYKEIRDWNFINQIHHSGDAGFLDSSRKFYWLEGEAFFAFSKYKDKALSEVVSQDPDFLRWILSADFSDDTKAIVRSALEGRKTELLANGPL